MVGDLHDDSAGLGLLLQPADQVDIGAGVHDGVGDQLADDEYRVLGEVHEVLGAGQARFGPLRQRGADEVAGGAGGQGAAGEGRAGVRVQVSARVRGRTTGTGHGFPLRRNGPHGQLPEQSDDYASVDADRVTDWPRP
ncbi:hypothetical protein SAURM35S_08711 [Streptomyces aurantiogriseus]